MAVKNTATLAERFTKSPPLLYYGSLSLTTVLLVVTFIVNILSSLPNATEVGFANTTGNISDLYYLQITPAGWTFSIWGIIYTWQALWVVYSWSFVCRSSTPRTVSWIAMLVYSVANVGNIFWIYLFGNNLPQVALAFILIIWLALISSASVQAAHLYYLTPSIGCGSKRIDLWIGRLLVVNGIAIYATWVSAATLLNFGIVLQYFGDVSPVTTGSVALWLLSAEVFAYFSLENTVLDRYTRFVFMVYPTLIWASSGILSAHWGKEDPDSSPVMTLLILLLAIGFFIFRCIKWIYLAVKYWKQSKYVEAEKKSLTE